MSAKNSGTFTLGGDLPVTRLGYGAMQLTGPGVWGDPKDPDEAVRVLRRAAELGVTLFDTADAYGPFVADLLIKKALHPYADDVVIATKAGFTRQGPNQWIPVGRPEYLRQQVELSLRHLGLDRIDLLQLHRIDPKVPLAEQVGELKKLQDEGKIRHIGLSEVSVDELEGSAADRRDRLRPEPLQPRQARRRAAARPRHRARHRLHPVVPAGHRRPRRPGQPADRAGEGARRVAVAARARVAAQAVARRAADPGDVVGRAPRGQRRGRRSRPHRRRVRRAVGRRGPLSRPR